MNDRLNSRKGFLKDKLGGYQADPPEKVWDAISSELGGRSRRGMIIVTLSVAATIALAITLGINYFGPEVHEDAVIADKGVKETGREALEEKVAITLEELEMEEIEGEEVATEEMAGEKLVMEEMAGEKLASEESETELIVGEESALPEVADNEVVVLMVAETSTDRTAIATQTDEVTGTEPAADQVEEETDADDAPVTDMDMGGKKDPRWIIGAALSPLYTFRDAEAAAMNSSADYESGMVSYAAGVHVSYKTTSRLAIESGVYYNKMGIAIGAPGIQLFEQSFDFEPLGAEASSSNVLAISNSVGNIVSKSGDIYVNSYKLNASNETGDMASYASTEIFADQGIKQHLDYLELPFNLRYTVVDRAIELQLVGGLSTNLLVNNYVTMETPDGPTEIGYLTNIKNVNYSGNAGMGFIYHIQEQFSLYLEPRFRYFLNSVNDGTLPNTRPYTFGVYTGLSYTF